MERRRRGRRKKVGEKKEAVKKGNQNPFAKEIQRVIKERAEEYQEKRIRLKKTPCQDESYFYVQRSVERQYNRTHINTWSPCKACPCKPWELPGVEERMFPYRADLKTSDRPP